MDVEDDKLKPQNNRQNSDGFNNLVETRPFRQVPRLDCT